MIIHGMQMMRVPFRSEGFTVVEMWESDWRRLRAAAAASNKLVVVSWLRLRLRAALSRMGAWIQGLCYVGVGITGRC